MSADVAAFGGVLLFCFGIVRGWALFRSLV